MKFSHYFGYLFIRCLGVLPYRLLYFMGVLLGQLYWLLSSRDRKVSIRNMELCFPSLNAQEQRNQAKKSLIHTAINACESPWAWQNRYPITRQYIRETEGQDLFDASLKANHGTIFLLAHFGHWEIMGDYFGHNCDNPAFLGREFGVPLIDNYIKQGRERSGGTIYPCTKEGLQQLYQATSEGRSTGILADQQASKAHGVFAPLFGVEAITSVLAQDMIQKTGAKVIMTSLMRLPKGQGFKLRFAEPDPDIYSNDIQTATSALNRSYEALILQDPAQYTWNYKRFKSRPEGEDSRY